MRSKSPWIIAAWQHAVIKLQGFMHFPSSPPEWRPLGNGTRLWFQKDSANKVVSEDLLSLLKSWREIEETSDSDRATWIPRIPKSCPVANIPIFTDQPIT